MEQKEINELCNAVYDAYFAGSSAHEEDDIARVGAHIGEWRKGQGWAAAWGVRVGRALKSIEMSLNDNNANEFPDIIDTKRAAELAEDDSSLYGYIRELVEHGFRHGYYKALHDVAADKGVL